MAYQGIGTGTSPNDNNGDSLLTGAVKINSNFKEIYNALGDGTTINFTKSRTITSGNGLTGGGDLSSDRTLNVGQGDGISVSADAVAVDNTVVRTNGNQTISGILTATTFDGNGTIPIGGIIMWSGSTAPTGWQLCNNTIISSGPLSGQFTPDLRDRFIVGATSGGNNLYPGLGVNATGGSANATLVSHSHTLTGGGLGGTTSFLTDVTIQTATENVQSGGATVLDGVSLNKSSGSVTYTNPSVNPQGFSEINQNLPPYYALAFIMRVS